MKIVYIANVRLPTEKAHGIQIMKMCEAFAMLGHEITLIVPNRKTSIAEDPFEYYGVKQNFVITRIPIIDTVGWGSIGFLFESVLFGVLALLRPVLWNADILFSRDELPLYPISFLKKNIIWESHDGRTNIAARRLLRVARQVIVTTGGIRDIYLSRGVASDKLLLARNGVDLDAFQCDAARITELRALLAPHGESVVLYAGRLDGWKGVRTLLDASRALPTNVRVVVVGGEPEQVAAFGCEYPNVTFVGFVPYREICCYQQAADVLVLPNTAKDPTSVSRTSPLKLFTYMAAGKPIVASDLPSIREIVDDDSCYFAVPDDPQAFAQGIMDLLDSPREAKTKAARAKKRVAGYTWVRRAERITGFIFRP